MSADYVTDVNYVRSFDNDLSPSRLRLAAALNGFPTPPTESFDYCELGCGHGDTAIVLAAANPQARFLGVDLNAEHVAFARRMASEGGLENVRFLECDFESLATEKLPDFDFICAHGVLSWVGPEKRKAIFDFASARLKPGGLLYVSYNAMPGWAAVEPLRQLLVSRTTAIEGDSAERARQGLAFVKQMHDGGAEYFKQNPAAAEMLRTMEAQGLAYVVHEYLNAHWTPMYFAQVAWQMAACDLHFVGQLPLFLNYRDLSIPPDLAKLFATVVDRSTFESLKDFALNEFFRKDIYIKGRPGRSADETNAYLDSSTFGLLADVQSDREVRLPHATLRFDGALFDALFAAVARGAVTGAALCREPALLAFGVDQARAALVRALLGGHVAPTLQPTRSAETPSTEALLRVASAYNESVLRGQWSRGRPLVLASPVTGSGVSITMLEAIAIRLLTEVPVAARAEWLRVLLGKDALRLVVQGEVVEDEAAQARVVLDELDKFRTRRLAKLVELGVLAL